MSVKATCVRCGSNLYEPPAGVERDSDGVLRAYCGGCA